MNMMRLRQIIELRKASKAPPLIPPKMRKTVEVETRRGPREVVDVHLQLRRFGSTTSRSDSIACLLSESEDGQQGPWKFSTASDIVAKQPLIEMPFLFAVEFQLERHRYVRIDVCDMLEYRATSLGYVVFSISELVVCEDGAIVRDVVNDETGEMLAEARISCTLRSKPHSVLLQFVSKNLGRKQNLASAGAQFYFEVQTKSGDKTALDLPASVLYRSEQVKAGSSRVLWRAFSLQSTDIANKSLQFSLVCRDNKSAKSAVGRFQTDYESLRRGPGPENAHQFTYANSKGNVKGCGEMQLARIAEVAMPSFLEFISSGTVMNLAIAIDFSQPDSYVDEAGINEFVDDVNLVIRALGEPLKDFSISNSFASFGFGAKVPPHFRESQEFCLVRLCAHVIAHQIRHFSFILRLLQNLEMDPYCKGLDGVQRAFKSAFASVQPLNTAHLSHVIYYVAKLAQSSLNRQQMGSAPPSGSSASLATGGRPCYYVLVIVTRGVFDDLKETVQAVIFASRAPISVVFVGIGSDRRRRIAGEPMTACLNEQPSTSAASAPSSTPSPTCDLDELERLATAGTRLNFHGRRPERDCVQYVSVERCRREERNLVDLRCAIAEKALINIPWQMTSWMTKNGFKPQSKIIADPPSGEPATTSQSAVGDAAGRVEARQQPAGPWDFEEGQERWSPLLRDTSPLPLRPPSRAPPRFGVGAATVPSPLDWTRMEELSVSFGGGSEKTARSYQQKSSVASSDFPAAAAGRAAAGGPLTAPTRRKFSGLTTPRTSDGSSTTSTSFNFESASLISNASVRKVSRDGNVPNVRSFSFRGASPTPMRKVSLPPRREKLSHGGNE